MLRLHSFLYSHRNMVKLVVIVAAVAAMTLGVTSGALADEGFDP